MSLTQNQSKPGAEHRDSTNPVKKTGRSTGLEQTQAKPGYPYKKDSNDTARRRPEVEGFEQRGYTTGADRSAAGSATRIDDKISGV